MIKFEPKYVHCFWDDELKGKKGFIADTIQNLRMFVEDKAKPYFVTLMPSENEDYQFTGPTEDNYQFCYYDPFYEIKVAYEEGKKIQYLSKVSNKWLDCECRPLWSDDFTEYRIKPKEGEYQVVVLFDAQGLAIVESGKDFRKVFFTGTKEECEKWLEDNKDIQTVVNGYFSDKHILYKEKGVKNDPWRPTKDIIYEWDFDNYEYRIATHEEFFKKVHSPKYVPFENTQELIEAWEKKCPANKDRLNGTMPLIWVASKELTNNISLITDFGDYGISTSYFVMSFNDLFEKYTFADGSICGKRK